jgi:hypothetical protein
MIGYIEEIRFVGEDGAPPVPVPPSLVSATILSDGVTLRLVFTAPIIAGDAEDGLSRSVGTITSGAVVGGNVDLTIPLVYAGDSVGTISYDANTGGLAGAGGFVESFGPVAITNDSEQVWTPASLPGIVDYGIWSDLSRLKQNSNGTGTVANVDDPIGWWRGQLDVLTFAIQIGGGAADKAKLASDGVYFLAAGSARGLVVTRTHTHPQAFVMAMSQSNASQAVNNVAMNMARSTSADSISTDGWCDAVGSTNLTGGPYGRIRSTTTNVSLGGSTAATTKQRLMLTYTGSAGAGWRDGSKTSISPGAINTATQTFVLSSVFVTGDAKCHAWVIAEQALSDADAALLDAWLAGV